MEVHPLSSCSSPLNLLATVSNVRVDVVQTEIIRPPAFFTRLIVSAVSFESR